MIVLIDTNVVLDHLLARAPFQADATRIFAAAETGRIDAFIGATTATTIHYVARKSIGLDRATRAVEDLVSVFQIASVTPAVIKSALTIGFPDFEDAVLHESGAAIQAHAIVTRNPGDFSRARIPVYEPPQLVSLLSL